VSAGAATAGCPRKKADPGVAAAAPGSGAPGAAAAAPAAPPPPWESVAALGKIALELPGALIPRGADALVPGAPGETRVYALKRDYASSALSLVDFSSPAAPTLAPPLLLHGPTSDAARLGTYVVLATQEAGRPPELCLARGTPLHVVERVKLDAPMLGPLAVSGDVVYVTSAAGAEGVPEARAPALAAYRLEGAADRPVLAPLGTVALPAPARAVAVVGRRLVVAVDAAPPIRSAPLDADGRPGALAWSLGYRIVQKIGKGEYAFEAAPRALATASAALVLVGDPHTTFLAVRVEDPPRVSIPPAFHHSRGGGLLAVEAALPSGAGPGAVASVYRLKGQRIFADTVDGDGRATPFGRWRLDLLGSGRAIALVPGLVLVADDSFGLYLFPR
jgi:hypothetical protein